MKIKVGDKVRVIAGSEKGKEGKVIKTFAKENRVVVEGVKLVKRHVKPNGQNETGGIQEAPIHVSNVKLLDAVKKEKKAKTTKKETKEVKEDKKKSSKKAQKED